MKWKSLGQEFKISAYTVKTGFLSNSYFQELRLTLSSNQDSIHPLRNTIITPVANLMKWNTFGLTNLPIIKTNSSRRQTLKNTEIVQVLWFCYQVAQINRMESNH